MTPGRHTVCSRPPSDGGTPDTSDVVLTSKTAYSNVFHKNGGNASFSVMANTLRGLYGTDVLIAPASSFTGSVLQADYTKATVRAMIMPNGLCRTGAP